MQHSPASLPVQPHSLCQAEQPTIPTGCVRQQLCSLFLVMQPTTLISLVLETPCSRSQAPQPEAQVRAPASWHLSSSGQDTVGGMGSAETTPARAASATRHASD